MSQLNVHVTPDFQRELTEYMRIRRLKTKSEAVRQAVHEALDHERRERQTADFGSWLGLGNRAPRSGNPRFSSDDDLWNA